MNESLAKLYREGEHILTLAGMDRQREEEEAAARLLEAQDRAFVLTRRTLELTPDEFEALEPLFREPDDEHHPVVILHAFGCELWIELVGMGDTYYDLGDAGVRVRLFPRMTHPDRSVIAQWLVLAERKQQRKARIQEEQAKLFRPFTFYRVWYGHGDDDYHSVRYNSVSGCYEGVHSAQLVWINNPVFIEEIKVKTPEQLPAWCPYERVEIDGELVPLQKTPEWAA